MRVKGKNAAEHVSYFGRMCKKTLVVRWKTEDEMFEHAQRPPCRQPLGHQPVDKVAKRRRFQENGTQEKARLDLFLTTFSASIFVERDFSLRSGIVV